MPVDQGGVELDFPDHLEARRPRLVAAFAVCLFVFAGVALAWFALVSFTVGFFARFAALAHERG